MTGKELYEAALKKTPNYHDGTPRRAWEKLEQVIQGHWDLKALGLKPALEYEAGGLCNNTKKGDEE